ncbi:MAG: glycosyltransferase family 9 protein, partial [candidate division KSB1 bacterium]|nr:glycosyltransferase family 9 protein [candidate division KSB1 bacterium]
FDTAIVLHPTLRLALLVFLARIPIRVGTGYRLYSVLFNRRVFHHRKTGRRHELEYNLELAEKIGASLEKVEFKFFIPTSVQLRVEKLLTHLGIKPDDRVVALHPGSGGSARDWPLARFAELNDRLVSELRVKTIVTAGPGEENLVATVIRQSRIQPPQWMGNLKELAALLKRANLLITNSTGPLHLAVAVGTEVIGFYCPIIPCLPSRWGPYGRPDSVLIPPLPPCKKCLNQNCAHYNCMDLIPVDEALALAKKKLFGE